MRRLKHHEQRLLRKVNFLQWKGERGGREAEVMRRCARARERDRERERERSPRGEPRRIFSGCGAVRSRALGSVADGRRTRPHRRTPCALRAGCQGGREAREAWPRAAQWANRAFGAAVAWRAPPRGVWCCAGGGGWIQSPGSARRVAGRGSCWREKGPQAPAAPQPAAAPGHSVLAAPGKECRAVNPRNRDSLALVTGRQCHRHETQTLQDVHAAKASEVGRVRSRGSHARPSSPPALTACARPR